MDDIPPTVTIYSMGEVLRWRAHALLVKSLSPPVEQWEDKSVWPAEFVTAVRIIWRTILRTASQRLHTGLELVDAELLLLELEIVDLSRASELEPHSHFPREA